MDATTLSTAQKPAEPVKFEDLEYARLRMLWRDAEIVAMQCQQVVQQAAAARDAFLQGLAEKYGFDRATIRQASWNDDTCEFLFS